jgi:hypothetical protein
MKIIILTFFKKKEREAHVSMEGKKKKKKIEGKEGKKG